MFRRLTPFQLTIDIVVASLCVLVRSVLPFDSWAGWSMLLLMGAALALRRVSPLLALALAWVGAVIQMSAQMPPDAANLSILAVLYATARYGDPLAKWLGLASAGLGAVVATAYLIANSFTAIDLSTVSMAAVLPRFGFAILLGFGSSAAVLGLSWTLGFLARTWADARLARRTQLEAERAVVVEQERNRIARDMHDVVAHSLAVVIAQADGARYAAATDPTAVDSALSAISGTAREALAEVRLLLAQLRHSQQAGPQPVLADLESLVDQVRASGLEVEVRERGEPPTLGASQQIAVYRIAQEALTNALRHGTPGQPVTLELEWSPDVVVLVASNPVAATADPTGAGHGITGMRERAHLVGGRLDAGPDGDRFVVRASIPVAS
ncbi:sensor histidine kinase [Salinibacterium soli]|uniref:histidine kinase n=1 Tax=Antiquaquibacter soli TaxID=3064523 RepID=A0ABT9BP66_9MICO|nr:histidine kinase [Protaetiibacter sp. WY-16]MDO7882187.1 histidine kinase [Protaetiibacter sp. WY-16]